MARHLRSVALPFVLGLLLGASLVACAAGGGTPSSAPSPLPQPSITPVPGSSEPPLPSVVTDAAAAAALALATDPRLAGIRPLDPTVIGASAWYEVHRLDMGDWEVTVIIGWGDCQAGCIDRHLWTFRVTPEAKVTLEKESGPPLPSPLPG